MRRCYCQARRFSLFSLLFVVYLAAEANTAVLQRGYTPDVAGANLSETLLTPANVNPASFGRIFSLPVDAAIYAQPLYVPNITVNGKIHNVVYVATMKDSVYAFDADSPGAPLWAINYANAIPGASPVQITDYVNTNSLNIAGTSGIESTPVIDLAGNTLYFVTNTKEVNQIVFRLHAVDLGSGAEKFNGPVVINGAASQSCKAINFIPKNQNQRASLALANDHVIVAFASHEDAYTYYGWVMSFDASNLACTGTFNPAPANHGAAVWQSGRPPVVDSAGYIYLYTGNGFTDTQQATADGVNNFAESALKLDPKTLQVMDYFTPDNFALLDADDSDLSSSGPSLIPGSTILVGGGKVGSMYLLDTQNLGKLVSNNPGAVQILNASRGEIHGGPVIWSRSNAACTQVNNAGCTLIYNWGATDSLKAFSYNAQTRQVNATPTMTFSGPPLLYPGGFMALSANGDQNGIIWASINSQGDADNRVAPGELVAINAGKLSQELWTSAEVPERDDPGLWSKFVPPLVVNGKVYLATQSKQLVVYGLLPGNGSARVTAWPAKQAALGGVANYMVSALSASGSPTPATWTISGLPTGAIGNFITDTHSRTVPQVQLGANTPRGSYRLLASANVGGNLTTQAVLLDVPDAVLTPVAGAAADSQISPHLAQAATDGNPSTFWESLLASTLDPNPPHFITLDLGKVSPVTGISYQPRQDGCIDGAIMQYEIYLSSDGVNWLTQTAGGSFDYGPDWRSFACNNASFPLTHTLNFPATNARYVSMKALGSVPDDDPWAATAGEVKIYVANGAQPFTGDFILASRNTGMVMDSQILSVGNAVTQQNFTHQLEQQWRFSPAATPGYYCLTN